MSRCVQACRLCDEVKPLCRSHIVPELAYAPIKDEKNQIFAVGRNVAKVQVGYRERMLCKDCEGLLSGYEGEFKNIWMDTIPPGFTHLRSGPEHGISVTVPNYDKFKLFHLSILWRAAVSQGFKVGEISLGPYERLLAKMIKERDPGQPGDFPFFGVLNLDRCSRPVPTVSPLVEGQGRFEDHRYYYMMSYAFCDWIFVVAQPGPSWMVEMEIACRNESVFLLLAVPHAQSKSFKLSVDIIRDLRR